MANPTMADLVELLDDGLDAAGRRRAGVAILRKLARDALTQPPSPDTEADLTVPADDDAIGLTLLVIAGETVCDLVDALEQIAERASVS